MNHHLIKNGMELEKEKMFTIVEELLSTDLAV